MPGTADSLFGETVGNGSNVRVIVMDPGIALKTMQNGYALSDVPNVPSINRTLMVDSRSNFKGDAGSLIAIVAVMEAITVLLTVQLTLVGLTQARDATSVVSMGRNLTETQSSRTLTGVSNTETVHVTVTARGNVQDQRQLTNATFIRPLVVAIVLSAEKDFQGTADFT